MEIEANIYAIADDREILKEAGLLLSAWTGGLFFGENEVEPNPILPLSRTWYVFSTSTGPTQGPDGWMDCLRNCACLLKKRGAVIVQFRSPDHPEDYLEYAYTTAGGDANSGNRCSLLGYRRALGVDDIRLVYKELCSDRTQYERDIAAKRKQKKEALRRARGGF